MKAIALDVRLAERIDEAVVRRRARLIDALVVEHVPQHRQHLRHALLIVLNDVRRRHRRCVAVVIVRGSITAAER